MEAKSGQEFWMNEIRNEIAVLFSGGIDSLLAVVELQASFNRVHLVTFNKGYLEFGVKNNQANVERLKRMYGEERIAHEVIDLRQLMRMIYKGLWKDIRIYNMETCWCVGCRLAMNSGGLLYALEHGLKGYADGSNREQIPSRANLAGTAENFPSVVERLKVFAREHGAEFLTPVYNSGSREERRARLRDFGFEIDYLSLDRSKKIRGMLTKDIFRRSQPICLSGWLIHWKRNLLGKPVKQDEKKTLSYIIQKLENVVRLYLRDYFAAKGVDVDELIKRRKSALNGRLPSDGQP